MMKDFEEFKSICKQELELELSDEQVDMFHVYYDLLIEWNQKMNLTAITELPDVLLKHFYDSVSVFHYTINYLIRSFWNNDSLSRKQRQGQIRLKFHAFNLMRIYPVFFSIQTRNFNHIYHF